MKKKIVSALFLVSIASVVLLAGCTSQSTQIAQKNSIRVQHVQNGIFDTTIRALSRENFETAKLGIEVAVLRQQMDLPKEQRPLLDKVLEKSQTVLKEFAAKRDFMTDYVKDFERANALKAVSVDAKLFSEQGILNYLAGTLSNNGKKFWTAWDAAKMVLEEEPKPEQK